VLRTSLYEKSETNLNDITMTKKINHDLKNMGDLDSICRLVPFLSEKHVRRLGKA
jgi:hypothetical protein